MKVRPSILIRIALALRPLFLARSHSDREVWRAYLIERRRGR